MHREQRAIGLLLASLLGLVLVSSMYHGHLTHVWLGWNTLLAFVPWAMSFVAEWAHRRNLTPLMILAGMGWLLFFPNAPYMVTDLAYMPELHAHLWWFNQIILFGIACTGLVIGFYSWRRIQRVIAARTTLRHATWAGIIVLYLAAFGVYLGRFSRWNSWDALTNPAYLLLDIADRFLNPLAHPRTWAFTVLFGTALLVGVWVVGGLGRRTQADAHI